jgi:radical SAM protein with 4Fe4S-binding SPASM domain
MNPFKELVEPGMLYEKRNSFDNFRSKKLNSLETILARVKMISIPATKDYFWEIVSKAIHSLLHETDNPKAFHLSPQILNEVSKITDKDLPRYLFYRYRYDIFPQIKQLDDYPPCVQVEVASICNYRCIFCYQTDSELTRKQNGHMGLMSLDLFKKVIDELEGKCEAITLASRGEPLVNRSIGQMLQYMSGKFLASKVNTNASLLTEERCHDILASDLQTLVFSCDAAEEPLYSELRVGGNLETVLKNIRSFKEIKEKQYPKSQLVTRVSGVKVNSHQDIDAMDRFWGELVDELAFVRYNPWENTYSRPINEEKEACSDLWRRCFVWWDGKINPCDVDYKSELCIGNIQEHSLNKLWTGENYNLLRQKHLNQKRCEASPCNRCTQI